MVVLSWLIFTWLYGGGDLDRGADRKSIDAAVKKMKKSFKKQKKGGTANYMVGKWMWFGSGFYGLAGLWTFVVIEVLDVSRFILDPSQFTESLRDGIVSTAIDVLMNQIGNVVTAFVWFSYWSEDSIIPWLIVAYLGYWIGVELARRGEDSQIQELIRRIRALIP